MSDELEESFDEDEGVDPFEGDSPDEEDLEGVGEDEIFDDDSTDDDDFADEDSKDNSDVDGAEEDSDEVEADLSEILNERITAKDDNDEEATEVKPEDGEQANVVTKQEDEIHCPSCFLLVSQTAIDQDGECSHCGAPV